MDDDYSTDLLLASLLNDNTDDSDTVHSSPQVSANQLLKTPSGSTQQNSITNPTSDDHFDSLEDLLNATLSPSEESYSDLDKTDTSLVSTPVSVTNATPPEVVSKASNTAVGLPPKFRNTFRPVEICDTVTTTKEFHETTFNSPSYVVASQASTNSNNVVTDGRLTTSSENTWQQLKNKNWNDSVCPPSKRFCSEDHVSSYNKSLPSVTTVTPSSVNTTTSLSGNDVYSNLLARTESNMMTQQHQQVVNHPVASTISVALNGVNSSANSVTTTATNTATIDLKRLQETNLVSELQAASTKPISSASIVHAIQVVQLNYGMLLQKLSQNLDDVTAQEVKTKLMVLTHHYKQLVQQYQAKLSAEKTGQLSSNVPATTGRVVTTNTTASIGSVTNYQSSTSNVSLVAAAAATTTTPSTVIDLTHDKSIKTTPTTTATNKGSCVTVTASQHLTSTAATVSAAGANVSSYLQSIPSLAAYLLQNTEAQKQLTPMELQQLNQIRVNLLQEFQRRQVQNFLTSLPADARPKNVNELKDMMKEKNFSIQIPPFLVAPVMKPSVSTTQFKQEMKTDPLMNFTDNKQMAMQAGSLSGHQQSVMATLLPHTMVNNVKSDEQLTSHQQDIKPPMLPGDVKSLTVTTQPQLFIGDMLQHLHSSQIAAAAAAGSAKLTTTMVSSLKSDIKREDTPTVSYATSQFLQGGTSAVQANNLLKNSTHRSYSNAVNPPSYGRSKIMAHNITRNIPGTSFSSKAAKYRAMAANVSSVADVSSLSISSSITKSSLHHSTSNSLTQSNSVSPSSTHYNTRAQLRTQRMIEEQKRLEEERIKQLTYTPEQLKTISNIKYFMQADHSRITKVDTQTPFHSKQDAFQRLSAYHVYYEPEPSEAIESRVEQMHDILARELMKKSRGLMAKYNQLLLRDEQKEVPKHIDLANERLFVEGELHKEHQLKEDCSAVQKSVTPVLDATAMSKLSSLSSQLIHDINVLHYTNAAGSVGIT